MKRVQRILLSFVLVLTCFVIYQVRIDVNQLQSEFIQTQQVLDLSVLDSCGIITNGGGFGSCVAIGSNLILTAGHCIDIPDTWIEIGGIKYDILNKWRSDKYDIGFITVVDRLPSWISFGEMPELLDEVYLVGVPYSTVFQNNITKGIISKFNVDWIDWIGIILTDAEGAPGSSGGPLFDVNGHIVGICIGGPNSGGGVTGCEPVSHIRQALSEYNNAAS